MKKMTPEEQEMVDRFLEGMNGAEAIIRTLPTITDYKAPQQRRSKHRNAKRTKARKRRG